MDLKHKLKDLVMSEFAYDLSKYEDEGEAKINNVTENLVKLFSLTDVSKRLLAEKIILALDDYGRSINKVEYGLAIDPDTKDFEDKRPKEMLKIVTDILNGC